MASKKASLIPKNVKNPLFSAGLANFPVEEFTQGVILVPHPKESEQLLTKEIGGEVDTFLGQNVTDLGLTQIPGSETEVAKHQPPTGPNILLPPPPTTSNFRAASIRISCPRPTEFIPPPVVKAHGESDPDFKQIPLDDSVPLYNPSAVLKSTTYQTNSELNCIVPPLDSGIHLYDPSCVGAVLPPHSIKRPIPTISDFSSRPNSTGPVSDPAFTSLSKHISTCSPSLVIDSGPTESTFQKQSSDVSRKSSSSSSVNELTATLHNSQGLPSSFVSPDSHSLSNNLKSNLVSQGFHQSASTPSFFVSATNFVGSLLSPDSSQAQPKHLQNISAPLYSSAPSLADAIIQPVSVNSASLPLLEHPTAVSSPPSSVTSPPFRVYQPIPRNTTLAPPSDFSPSAPPEPSIQPSIGSKLASSFPPYQSSVGITSTEPPLVAENSSLINQVGNSQASVSSNSSAQPDYSISNFFNQLNPFKIISPASENLENNQHPPPEVFPDSLSSSLLANVAFSDLNPNVQPSSGLSLTAAHSSPPTSKSPSSSSNLLPPPPLSGFQTSSAPLSSLPNVHHTYLNNPYTLRKKAAPAFKPEHYFTPISEGELPTEDNKEFLQINPDCGGDFLPTYHSLPQQTVGLITDQVPPAIQPSLYNPVVQNSLSPLKSSVINQAPLLPVPSSSAAVSVDHLTSSEASLSQSETPPISKTLTTSIDHIPPSNLPGFQGSTSPLPLLNSTYAANDQSFPVTVDQQQYFFKAESVPLFSSDQYSGIAQNQINQGSTDSIQIPQQKIAPPLIPILNHHIPEHLSVTPSIHSDSVLLQSSICSIDKQTLFSTNPLGRSETGTQHSSLSSLQSGNTQVPLPETQSLFSPVKSEPLAPVQTSGITTSSTGSLTSFPSPPPASQNHPPHLGPPPPSNQPTSYRLPSFKKPSYAPVPDLDFTPRPNVMSYHQDSLNNVQQGVFHPPHIQTHSNSVESTSSLTGSPGYQPFTAMAVNQTYRSVYHHWFYRVGEDQKNVWFPFSMADSLNLEQQYTSDVKGEGSCLVATDGGRYDVDVEARRRKAVYWHEAESEVRRCSWFVKGPIDSRYQPYDENIAALLEEEYKTACSKNEWNRRVELADGEVIIIHSPNTIAHHQRSSSPDPWGNPPPMQEKPRVVKRGLDEFEIPEGEPTQVDHLLLLVHGIGKVCDLRFRSLVEVVDDFRNISMSLVGSHYKSAVERGKAGRVEVLPVEWHRALHTDAIDQRLADITLPSIPKARQFTNETLLDILFYTSPVFCERIVQAVGTEVNRVYSLYVERNPGFKGGVSLGGHSLGSLILFDMLCHQKPPQKPKLQSTPSFCADESDEDVASLGSIKTRARLSRRMSYLTIGSAGTGQPYIVYPQLYFQPRAFFALGSPIGMFVTVRGIESLGEDFRFPTCQSFYNIFHPNDPVAYRIEGLINPEMAHHPAVLIPHHKGRKRMHLELKETMAHVTAAVKQKLVESVRNTWNTVYSLTRLNKIDPIVIEKQVDKVIDDEILCKDDASTSSVGDSAESEGVELKLGQLNGGRRIDYVLQEAPLETFNQYISAVRSHLVYWESEDTMLLILKEIYGAKGITTDSQIPQPILPFELSVDSNADPGTAYAHYTVSTTPPASRQHTIAEEL